MATRIVATVLALTAAALVFFPVLSVAQTYPSKTIRLIVPFPAGGGVDYIGRIVGKGLSERLGQQVLVDNRPGANAILGLEALKASPPDGYTIAAASAGPLAVNPFMYKKLPHDTVRHFTRSSSSSRSSRCTSSTSSSQRIWRYSTPRRCSSAIHG